VKILVTGGAGFIGSHVVDLLIQEGHQIIVVDDLSSGRPSNLNPSATFYHMDIRDPEMRKLLASEKPEVISHHAAQIDVRRSVADPLFDADVNILGSIRLVELAYQSGVRKFIHISSGGLFTANQSTCPVTRSTPFSHSAPMAPANSHSSFISIFTNRPMDWITLYCAILMFMGLARILMARQALLPSLLDRCCATSRYELMVAGNRFGILSMSPIVHALTF